MKTIFKYIFFTKCNDDNSKKPAWICGNLTSTEELGMILWYPRWRQYCFAPSFEAIFSAGCLADIQTFIAQLELDRKGKNDG